MKDFKLNTKNKVMASIKKLCTIQTGYEEAVQGALIQACGFALLNQDMEPINAFRKALKPSEYRNTAHFLKEFAPVVWNTEKAVYEFSKSRAKRIEDEIGTVSQYLEALSKAPSYMAIKAEADAKRAKKKPTPSKLAKILESTAKRIVDKCESDLLEVDFDKIEIARLAFNKALDDVLSQYEVVE